MAKKGENIYRRKDGRYEGRYIKGRRQDGSPVFGYIYGYSYSEVKSRLTLAKAASDDEGSVCIIGKGSMAEFLEYWLKHIISERVKLSTQARYYERIHGHIIPSLGHLTVCKISAKEIRGFADGLRLKGLAPATIAGIIRLLVSVMKEARRLRLINYNPCDGITLPESDTTETRALERSEQVALERMVFGTCPELELGVFLSLYAGLRIGELCALKWRDIELCLGSLTVRGTLQRIKNLGSGSKTVIVECAPKSKRSLRTIPLPTGMIERLRRYGTNKPRDSYVLTGTMKPIEPRALRARYDRLAAKAGIDAPFHALRHTFAARCLENNFDIQTVSELLGHSNAGVTMNVYAHSVSGHKRMLTGRVHILSETNEPSEEPSGFAATCRKL